MKKIKLLLLFFFVSLNAVFFAQDETQKMMRSFVPKSQAYDIYYPLEYVLEEGDDGIVTITDTITGMNITISSYHLSKKPKDVDIISQLNSFINDSYNKQHKLEDWNSYTSKFDNLVQLKTNFETTNWVWFGVNIKKSLVVISINKDAEISPEEINLVMFMIELMIIN